MDTSIGSSLSSTIAWQTSRSLAAGMRNGVTRTCRPCRGRCSLVLILAAPARAVSIPGTSSPTRQTRDVPPALAWGIDRRRPARSRHSAVTWGPVPAGVPCAIPFTEVPDMGRYGSLSDVTLTGEVARAERVSEFLRAVYSWMFVGLGVTAIVAYY